MPLVDVVQVLASQLPAWHLEAECRGADLSLFFIDERGKPYTAARAICGRCPVVTECLAWAITEDITEGVFGGLTPRERRLLADQPSAQGLVRFSRSRRSWAILSDVAAV